VYLYVPVAFVLFQLQYYIAQQWLVTSSSFFYMLLFSILSLHFFRRGVVQWSLLFGAIAIFCNANGFLILLGEVVLLMLGKEWRKAALFLGVLALCMFLYSIGYVPHENDKLLTFYYFKNPWPTILYALIFIGAPLNLVNGVAAWAGAGAFAYFIWLTYRKYYERNPVLYLLTFMLLSTAILAALGRSFWGVQQALESRYKIYSAVLWVCVFCSWVEEDTTMKVKTWYPWITAACFCFCLGSYATSWKYMVRFRERKEVQFADIYADKPIKVMSDGREILMLSIEKGYYKVPKGVVFGQE